MSSPDYDIAPYESNRAQQVAELMVYLWSADVEANLSYLRWKYESNPYSQQPLALVAVHHGRVVGFRGYTALPFQIAGTSHELIVLCPGDTCVHPEHRKSGLSVKMGRSAMRAYSNEYRLFMNWSSTKASLPGYLKLGFRPLAEKVYLSKASLGGVPRYLLASGEARPLSESRIRFGGSGKLTVAAAPRVDEMAALARAEVAAPGILVLRRDEAFLEWRFANPLGKYAFYYLLRGETLEGYVAVGLSPNNRRAFMLDYAVAELGMLAEIAQDIIGMRHFDVLSVYAFCLTAEERLALKRLGFGVTSLLPLLERVRKGRIPLLIRPVTETFSDDDFRILGVDTRQLENWSLRPLGSDAG